MNRSNRFALALSTHKGRQRFCRPLRRFVSSELVTCSQTQLRRRYSATCCRGLRAICRKRRERATTSGNARRRGAVPRFASIVIDSGLAFIYFYRVIETVVLFRDKQTHELQKAYDGVVLLCRRSHVLELTGKSIFSLVRSMLL